MNSQLSAPCEILEERTLLSGTSPQAVNDNYVVDAGGVLAVTTSANQLETINPISVSSGTGEKPQSKVWSHGGNWWAVFAVGSGTYVWKLEGANWTQALYLSSSTSTQADVKSINGVVHIFMQTSSSSASMRSIEFNAATSTYQYWSQQPNITNVPIASSVETITLDVDSTGRMWMAYEASGQIRVRYSDGNYTSWSSEIVLATGINGDDLAAVVALPGRIGVFWSNQSSERFGFRMHVDGTDPTLWSSDEVPASQYALNVGGGMADDHINLEVKADGTLYVAAKTSYDSGSYPRLILLVRRPNGTWDQPYAIDSGGTRPTIAARASTGELIYAYRNSDSHGPIMYRQLFDNGSTITVGAEQLLIDGSSYNNVSSTKDPFNDDLVLISSGSSNLAGARLKFRSGVLVNDTDAEGDSLTASLVAGPQHGNVVFNSDGTFTYTHNGNLATSDSFTYRAWDGTSWSNVATVSITITQAINNPPVAQNDSYSITKGSTLNANDANGTVGGTNDNGVLVNDTDADGNLLTAILVSGPAHGSLTLNSNGTFTYTHNGNTATSDSFTYRAYDGKALSNIATVTISIAAANNPPVATNDSYSIVSGATLNANDANGTVGGTNDNGVLVNDTDADGNPLTAILVSGPAHGSLTLNSNGTFTYTHNGNSATSDSFTYRAYDGAAQSNLATVTISIAAGSSPITTSFQDGVNGYTGTTDATIRGDNPNANSGSVTNLENDGSPDLATLFRWNVGSIAPGSTVQSASITLYLTNSSSQSYELYRVLRPWIESQVTWNQAANGLSWSVGGAQGSGDMDPAFVASVTPSSTGSMTITLGSAGIAMVQSWINDPSSNNGVIFMDYLNSNGFDIDSREVSTVSRRPMLTVTYTSGAPVNNPPVGTNDTYTVTQGSTLNANDANGTVGGTNDNGVLVNDTDPENNPLTAILAAGPAHASAFTLNANGTFTYTHNGNSATSDTFTYRASDGTNLSNLVTVTITINPVPTEPPSITATASTLTYTENEAAKAIDSGLTTSDPDSTNFTGATVSITGGFAAGQDVLGFVNQNGITGSYNTNTGILTLTGTASIANYQAALRSVTYVNNSENPSTTNRTITFSVNDGTQSASASRTINVIAVNDPPVTVGDSYSVTQGATLNANDANGTVGGTNDNSVLVNDTDPENNPLTTILVTGPAHGSLTLNPNGTFTYTHNGNSATSDSFSYRAFDGSAQGNIATVSITITPPNPDPVTVSFQDGVNGYAGTADATIRSDNPNANSGSVTNLETDGSPDLGTLIRWNTSSIPIGSIVQSATITLNLTNSSPQSYEFYQVLRSWVESQVTWNQAANGVSWTTGGAQGSGDRAATPFLSVVPSSTGTLTINLDATGLAVIQSWIDNPSANNGFIIQDYANSNGFDISSRESSNASLRPRLSITYVAGSPLIADQAAAVPTTVLQAGGGSLAGISAAAQSYWLSTADGSSIDSIRRRLAGTNIQWANLSGNLLATASSNTIYLDIDAAGYGWFLDATPWDNTEFGTLGSRLEGNVAAGRIDLLSVLVHEFGHILGQEHSDEGVMHESLSAGERTVSLSEAGLNDLDSIYTGISLSRDLTPLSV